MKKTKGMFRLMSFLLAMLLVASIASVGAIAENMDDGGNVNTGTSGALTPVADPSVQDETSGDGSASTTSPVTTAANLVTAYLEYDNYKKDYFTGETFDPTGINVVLVYMGLPSKVIPLSEYGNYNTGKLKASDKGIVVTVAGYDHPEDLTIPISVQDIEVKSVKFGTVNYKQVYLQGEKFDPNGITLEVEYTNGQKETVSDTSKFTVYPSTPLESNGTVKISYGGKTVPGSLNYEVKAVTSLTIATIESRVVFGQYQVFDKSKITVTANYADGQTRVVDDYTAEHGGFEAAGNGKITIRYYSASAELDVSVVELIGIRVTKNPTKMSYNEREHFNSSGLEVSGVYSIDGVEKCAVISGYDIASSMLIPDVDGNCDIIVSFKGFTETITVAVSPIVKLNITKNPDKLSYYEGDMLDLTGIIVEAVFANGQKIENFTDYTVPADSLYVSSTVLPCIKYGNVQANISVTAIAIQAIGVTKNPNRIIYTEGEIFDPTGIEITAFYTDDTYRIIEAGACVFPTEGLAKYDTKITIKYKNFSCQLDVIVTDKVYAKSFDAVVLPKVNYISGEKLTLDGIKLVLTLSDDTTVEVDLADVTVSPAVDTQLFAGIDTEIVISYLYNGEQDIKCTIPINVLNKSIQSLFISKFPDKMEYKEGEIFDPSGMIVRAYYNDNTTEEITNYTVTNNPFILPTSVSQDVRVYITVGDYEQSFVVTVHPVDISMISVTTPPNKVSYNAGETFDPAGMVVKVTYVNGSTFVISDELYTIVNGTLTAGDSVVTVDFRGKTTAISVSVSGDVTSGDETTPNVTTPAETTPDVTTPKETDEKTIPGETTTAPTGDETQGTSGGGIGGIQVIFICMIILIVALIVVLVIYYRRHFC